MNLTIMPGAATEDAKQIEEIVRAIDESMATLDEVIKRHIPDGIETEWSTEFSESWSHYYDDSIHGAMDAMKASAENLKAAVDAALEYNK